MTKSKKRTKFVRIQMDFVLEYDEDMDSLPGGFGFVNINDFIVGGVAATTLKNDKPRARVKFNHRNIVAISSGAKMSSSLDYRKKRA